MSDTSGSLFLRAGLVTRAQITEAEKVRQADGGTLGECLIRLGILDENQIADFYQSRLMVPRVERSQLAKVGRAALAAVPADMAVEFRVFPVEIDAEGTLLLAMADPSDAGIADEVMFFTDRFCQRAVAPESWIREAIEKYYGVRITQPRSLPVKAAPRVNITPGSMPRVERSAAGNLPRTTPTGKAVPPPVPANATAGARPAPTPVAALTDEPLLLTRVKQPPAPPEPTRPGVEPPRLEIVDEDLEEERPQPGLTVEVPTELHGGRPWRPISSPPGAPRLEVVPDVDGDPYAPPDHGPPADLDDENTPILLTRAIAQGRSKRRTIPGLPILAIPDPPLAALRAAANRDEIASTLVTYLSLLAPRAAMFVMRKTLLVGLDGRGGDLDVEGLRRIQIPTDAPSLFRDVIQSRLPYRGPLPATPANRAFAHMMGEREGDVLVFPIAVRDKVIAVLYADGVLTPLPDATLHAMAHEAGNAYERLILNAKQ